ncbi:type-F conjugative transfer system mating-pair stabilization protein TraN [Photobacterium damselae]|uniref:type-F conjugative transfer system mating-pair stabilization protein TraN n=1 Tax=Photobacterium damselae TaxID=38293 RepID=UPI0040679C2E
MKWLAVALLALSFGSHADISSTYYSEVQNAKDSIGKSLNSSAFKSFNAESYCNNDPTCIKEMKNPSQSQYFGNDAALVAAGQQQLVTNPNAANITDGFNNRPKHTLDPNDPALSNAKGYMDNSYEISHGLSNKYYNCETGQVCNYQDSNKQCQLPTNNASRCELIPYPVNVGIINERHIIPVHGEFGRLPLPKTMEVSSIDLPALRRVPQEIPGYCTSYTREVTVNIHINGELVKKIRGSYDSYNLGYSCRISVAMPATTINFATPKKLSSILIDFSPKHYFNMTANGNIVVHSKKENVEMGWRNNCPTFPRECRQTQEVCTEGAGTRYINGVPIYMSCWKKQRTYQCNYPNTCSNLLGTQGDTTCSEKSRNCKISILGQCLAYDVALQCSTKQCEDRSLVCGNTFFCLDGECYDSQSSKNDDFSKSASSLAAAGEAAESFSADNLKIFSGKPATCSKKPIGLSDCCADSGWGNDLGLTQCSAEEKGLAQAKEKGLTISLGTYCAEKVLGVCIRKKKAYCQFESKMARIVQQQGRKQLHLDFGSAKHPKCEGITPEQLQQLDFSKIDFSEFYGDLEANMELPDMTEVQNRIKDKYKDLGAK